MGRACHKPPCRWNENVSKTVFVCGPTLTSKPSNLPTNTGRRTNSPSLRKRCKSLEPRRTGRRSSARRNGKTCRHRVSSRLPLLPYRSQYRSGERRRCRPPSGGCSRAMTPPRPQESVPCRPLIQSLQVLGQTLLSARILSAATSSSSSMCGCGRCRGLPAVFTGLYHAKFGQRSQPLHPSVFSYDSPQILRAQNLRSALHCSPLYCCCSLPGKARERDVGHSLPETPTMQVQSRGSPSRENYFMITNKIPASMILLTTITT